MRTTPSFVDIRALGRPSLGDVCLYAWLFPPRAPWGFFGKPVSARSPVRSWGSGREEAERRGREEERRRSSEQDKEEEEEEEEEEEQQEEEEEEEEGTRRSARRPPASSLPSDTDDSCAIPERTGFRAGEKPKKNQFRNSEIGLKNTRGTKKREVRTYLATRWAPVGTCGHRFIPHI